VARTGGRTSETASLPLYNFPFNLWKKLQRPLGRYGESWNQPKGNNRGKSQVVGRLLGGGKPCGGEEGRMSGETKKEIALGVGTCWRCAIVLKIAYMRGEMGFSEGG